MLGQGSLAGSPTWVGVNPIGIQSIRGRLPSGLGGHRAVAVDAQGSRDGRDGRGSDGRRGAGSWGGESGDKAEKQTHTDAENQPASLSEQTGAGGLLSDPDPLLDPVASHPYPHHAVAPSSAGFVPGPSLSYLRMG